VFGAPLSQTYNIHYSRRSSGLAETAIVSDQSKIFFCLLIPLYGFLVRQFAILTTTAIYLRMSGQEAKGISKEKGLI
jgi:hypothetical protein